MTTRLAPDLSGSGIPAAMAGLPVAVVDEQVLGGVTHSLTVTIDGGRRRVKLKPRYVVDEPFSRQPLVRATIFAQEGGRRP